MVAIPLSPGARVAPQATPTSVAPINPTAIGNAISELGQVGMQVSAERMAFETRRTQALQSAKAMDYSTQIQGIDNDFELQAQQMPSTPSAFQGMSDKLQVARQKKIEELLANEQDPVVKDLAMRSANTQAVQLKDKFNRYQLTKEAEYGQHVITTKLDKIGEELGKTYNSAKIGQLQKEIESTLKTGLASRYIDYNFIDSYQDKLKRISAARDAETAQRMALNAYLDGSAFADPNNAKDKALVNGAFSRMIKSNDPNLQAQAIELSARTGIVPAQLVSGVSGNLFAGNVQQKVKAAEIVSQLIMKNPRAISAFPQTVQVQALSINRSIEAGISPEQAVLFSEQNLKENKDLERTRREQTFQMDNTRQLREKSIENLKNEISDIPWSRKSAEVPDALIGQYEYLTKEFYMNTGASYEDATAHAASVIKSQWKMTDIGGKPKLQKYAPEAMYPYGSSTKWIKSQLLDTLSGKPDIESQPLGLIERGNIDLSKRIPLKNEDGTISPLKSISIEQDGNIVLIPTIQDGKRMTNAEAIRYYQKTGQNLGVFETEADAARYAKRVSKFEGQRFKSGVKTSALGEGVFIADKLERPNFFAGKTPEEINSQIELVVDPDSVSTGFPSYLISRSVDEFGLKEVILGKDNQPLRFTPDFTKTEEYAKSYSARKALSVTPEVYAEGLYQKAKQREEAKLKLSPSKVRAASLIGGEAFK
jgi:hypothetical protein